MATLKDVAKMAGVSTATVSYVINGTKKITPETTQRVFDAIEKTNYIPHSLAKSLRIGKTLTIGVLVEDIRGLPIADIVNGLEESLEVHGYQMILKDLHMLEKLYNQYDAILDYKDDINNSVSLMLRSHVDGIIYVGLHDRHLNGIIDPIDKPFVYAYSHGAEQDHYVTYNNICGARDAVNYLVKNGHREIATIAGHPDSFPTQQRMEGFLNSMKAAGLAIRREYIRYGDWEYESGYQQAQKLLTLPNRPTAIFAMNDLMAAGCLNAALEYGLNIPQELSIVGFDNREIAKYLLTPLTTIQLPNNEIGHESAKMLISLIKDKELKQRHVILPCSLIERASVAPIKTVV